MSTGTRHHRLARALVEGFAPDAIGLARWLAERDHDVLVAGPGPPPPEALALRADGVEVEEIDLDRARVTVDVAYLDVWTPEVAPRVARLRAGGARLTCLADLLLERSPVTTVGVTGTAGKSTTTAFAVQMLHSAGMQPWASTTARAGNLWPTEELLPVLDMRPPSMLVLELTSSHLAFCATSPSIAVVTSFWPDHLELHGSLGAYRHAKEAIVRHQTSGDAVVVGADDPESASFAAMTPALRWSFSATRPVERGVSVAGAVIVATTGGITAEIGPVVTSGTRLEAILAAATASLAAGASPEAIGDALPTLVPPPFRGALVGRIGTTDLIDDSMAATPAKAASTLAAFPDRSVVVVVGGESELGGLAVHATADERELLDEACVVLRRVARAILPFGPAGEALGGLLGVRDVAPTLEDAVSRALALADGAAAVVVSPMFPISLEDRERVAAWLRSGAEIT